MRSFQAVLRDALFPPVRGSVDRPERRGLAIIEPWDKGGMEAFCLGFFHSSVEALYCDAGVEHAKLEIRFDMESMPPWVRRCLDPDQPVVFLNTAQDVHPLSDDGSEIPIPATTFCGFHQIPASCPPQVEKLVHG